jgi:thymidine kinase
MTIEAYTGPMYCEKTGRMIREIRVIEHGGWEQGVDYEVFNHSSDTRYGEGVISTHDGIQVPSYMARDSFDILDRIAEWDRGGWRLQEKYMNLKTIFIDEAEFFDMGLIEVVEYIDRALGVDVYLAGLDTDFRGEPFPGPMPGLLAIADKVSKYKAGCSSEHKCGDGATRTQRIVDGVPAGYHDEVILVGAKEAYQARCRSDHVFREDDPKPVPFADRFSK